MVGPGRDTESIADWEIDRSRDLKTILKFWLDYFKDVLKLGDAQARERAEEMATISMQDDIDIMDLIDLL